MAKPKISILIPTLNSEKVLEQCLASIKNQDYPKEDVELIIADGGSKDKTRDIGSRYGAIIVENPLKTGEAGKMAALRKATGEYIALIDSDNFLPDKDWIANMVEPLEKHPEALGSEPYKYTWRNQDGFITRYCALMGVNDPLVFFLGNYDRLNLISNKWTEVVHDEKDFDKYLLLKFDSNITKILPTIGANGTVFRSSFLKQFLNKEYLFDIDILSDELRKSGAITFIKVKIGIIHSYCESDINKFIRKQIRRAQDYLFFKKSKESRTYNWSEMDLSGGRPLGLIKFILFCLTIIPLLYQSLIGYSRKKDSAWFFHILACEITFLVYSWYRVFGFLYDKEFNRGNWKQ